MQVTETGNNDLHLLHAWTKQTFISNNSNYRIDCDTVFSHLGGVSVDRILPFTLSTNDQMSVHRKT